MPAGPYCPDCQGGQRSLRGAACLHTAGASARIQTFITRSGLLRSINILLRQSILE